jgi:hypothetical protein
VFNEKLDNDNYDDDYGEQAYGCSDDEYDDYDNINDNINIYFCNTAYYSHINLLLNKKCQLLVPFLINIV